MNYTLNQLRIFKKIVKYKSITKAAAELHLSQPAVSIQLKNLQDQFEIPLTEVIGRKLYITDFGMEIAESADKILGEAYAMKHKALAHRGQISGRLRISSVSTGKYVTPYFISEFLKKNPGVNLRMDVTNKYKIKDSLSKNEIDFAMVSVLPEDIAIERVELLQNKLYLFGGRDYKIEEGFLNNKELENMPLIFREKGSATRNLMEDFIKKNGLNIQKKLELTSNEAVKQAVIAGIGFSIMPLIGMKNELNNGDIKIIPTKQLPIITEWNLIWVKNRKFSPAARAYVDFVNEEKERIIKELFDWSENYK